MPCIIVTFCIRKTRKLSYVRQNLSVIYTCLLVIYTFHMFVSFKFKKNVQSNQYSIYKMGLCRYTVIYSLQFRLVNRPVNPVTAFT